eukprot:CAMPEP_0176304242 /NCGR_PEP_ID=MMETSP0121_2-20121125/62330_1 /TAXON_ID=160619 /ORGANISM="Kryptoperidinium foliaceum, Strain CCMP 1326" /LENGTH=177 /DNA_ID=CAMNT_0017645843 /DNA_START=106 /DNA_END=641 /DNA_ORIENTATION=-
MYALLAAATVSEKCGRVPAFINAISFGAGSERKRQHTVEYIASSAAGFYILDTRLTTSMVAKMMYIWCIVVLGALTRLTARKSSPVSAWSSRFRPRSDMGALDVELLLAVFGALTRLKAPATWARPGIASLKPLDSGGCGDAAGAVELAAPRRREAGAAGKRQPNRWVSMGDWSRAF